LTAAALLAQRGLKVAVFEQHFLPGGFCTSWERIVQHNGERWRYVFDAGVHDVSGLGSHGSFRNLLRMLNIEDRIEWKRNQQEFFQGGTHLIVPHDGGEFARLLGEHFPAEAENILAYFNEMRLIYEDMVGDSEKTGGAPQPPDNVDDMLAYPKNHPHAFKWLERPYPEMLDAYFQDARLKELLSALTGYLSDDATTLTVGHMAPIFGYYFEGGYYPAGGSQVIADALVQVIEENDGRLFLRTSVSRIVIENGHAAGVQLMDGTIHRSKAVLSNADAHKTFLELMGREHLPAKFADSIAALKPSTSAFIVFLGLDFVPEIASVTMGPGVGIMLPSKIDPSLAPSGHSAMTLLRLIPQAEAVLWDRESPDYHQRKKEYADGMIAAAEEIIPGSQSHITYRQEGSPATFARYAWTTGGSIYGPATGQSPLHIKTPLSNLYLAGSSVMGSGAEAAIIAGIRAANAIYRK
jgi:all-trans-retinol 13,14-reductase